MKLVCTCYNCGFPKIFDEDAIPEVCPICGAPRSKFLTEPCTGNISDRRIHVDPPAPDPDRDPYDISFHAPKVFRKGSLHGRIRRLVLYYDDPAVSERFYREVFGWDIIPTQHADPKEPLLYCATGPGFPNWEPKYASFTYVCLKSRRSDESGMEPGFVVEVDDIDETLSKVEDFGGKILKDKYEVEGCICAVLGDGEGNAFYIWQTPENVNWDAPECRNDWRWVRHRQTLADVPETPNGVPAYPGRPPKKFPKKDLHGRARMLSIYYDDFYHFQRFYTELFGWDFCILPGSSSFIDGETPPDKPHLIIATGPSYETYEGLVPGHVNILAHYRKSPDMERTLFTSEIHMDEPVVFTARNVLACGGRVLNAIEPDEPGKSAFLEIADPAGNRWSLWRCPDSRTWDEAETYYDIEADAE